MIENSSGVKIQRSNNTGGFAITLKRCSNETSPVVCKSEAEIEKWTKEHSVSLHARRSYVAYEDVEPFEGPVKYIAEEIAAVENYDFIQSKNIWLGLQEH